MNPIIKWPGGKSKEIDKIQSLIPEFDRYIEPFFGGGAVFFHIAPKKAAINDISRSLMQYYRLVKEQNSELHALLQCYCDSFHNMLCVCRKESCELLHIFFRLKEGALTKEELKDILRTVIASLSEKINSGFRRNLLLSQAKFEEHLLQMVSDKFIRTVSNYNKKPFSTEDLCENLITGFASGYYMYFREVFNDISLGRVQGLSAAYESANFYFIREYCYGSMFRYNAKGEFNIPYGGMSYNRKDMRAKIENIFNPKVESIFHETELYCCDFERFLSEVHLTPNDFMFLDPPYDTDFSDYEGKDFSRHDQARLAELLRHTPAKFILVIKNTEFIYSLYEHDFTILSFDTQYAYNVRSRNDRDVEHLIITNLSV